MTRPNDTLISISKDLIFPMFLYTKDKDNNIEIIKLMTIKNDLYEYIKVISIEETPNNDNRVTMNYKVNYTGNKNISTFHMTKDEFLMYEKINDIREIDGIPVVGDAELIESREFNELKAAYDIGRISEEMYKNKMDQIYKKIRVNKFDIENKIVYYVAIDKHPYVVLKDPLDVFNEKYEKVMLNLNDHN